MTGPHPSAPNESDHARQSEPPITIRDAWRVRGRAYLLRAASALQALWGRWTRLARPVQAAISLLALVAVLGVVGIGAFARTVHTPPAAIARPPAPIPTATQAPSLPVTEFSVRTANSSPGDIAVGPDKNLWFTELAGNRIGRLTPSGIVTEFALPHPSSAPVH